MQEHKWGYSRQKKNNLCPCLEQTCAEKAIRESQKPFLRATSFLFQWTARNYQVPPPEEKHTSSWVILSGSNPDLHGGQRWEKSAATDSHTNLTWDGASSLGPIARYFANIQPMSLTYMLLLKIILPNSHNYHTCLISVIKLEAIDNFLTENIYHQIKTMCFTK